MDPLQEFAELKGDASLEEAQKEAEVASDEAAIISDKHDAEIEAIMASELGISQPSESVVFQGVSFSGVKDVISKYIGSTKQCAKTALSALSPEQKKYFAIGAVALISGGGLYYMYYKNKQIKPVIIPYEKSTEEDKKFLADIESDNRNGVGEYLKAFNDKTVPFVVDKNGNSIFHLMTGKCNDKLYASLSSLFITEQIYILNHLENNNGHTPMMLSIIRKCPNLFSMYFERAVVISEHIKHKDKKDRNLLHLLAIASNKVLNSIFLESLRQKWLQTIAEGAMLDKDFKEKTPIDLAIALGNLSFCEMVFANNLYGQHYEKVAKLIYKKRVLERKNEDGTVNTFTVPEKESLTARDFKLFVKGEDIADDDIPEVVELTGYGMDTFHHIDHSFRHKFPEETLQAENGQRRQALSQKIIHGKFDEVQNLLLYGLSPFHEDVDGYTAYHYAALYDRTDVIRILPDIPQDKTLKTINGLTPLFFTKDTRTLDALIKKGVDPYVLDKRGSSFLNILSFREETKVIDWLKKNHPDIFEKLNKKSKGISPLATVAAFNKDETSAGEECGLPATSIDEINDKLEKKAEAEKVLEKTDTPVQKEKEEEEEKKEEAKEEVKEEEEKKEGWVNVKLSKTFAKIVETKKYGLRKEDVSFWAS